MPVALEVGDPTAATPAMLLRVRFGALWCALVHSVIGDETVDRFAARNRLLANLADGNRASEPSVNRGSARCPQPLAGFSTLA